MKFLSRLFTTAGLVGAIASMATPAEAVTVTGKITSLFVSQPANYGFRVTMSPGLSSCTGLFAFSNASDGNYNVFVSALTTAYVVGANVNVVYNVEAGNYCRIGEFQVGP